LTVSLVTHDGMRWLPGCLASLAAQDLQPDEVVVLDNASTDGTADWLRDQAGAAGFRLIESPTNLGFAGGHNRVLAETTGTYVLLLNQDVELDPGFLRAAVGAFEARPGVAAVQGRVRRLGQAGERLDRLDTTGLVMHRDRRFVSRGQGEPDGPAHQRPGEVFGADGPVPVYRRAALHDARLPRSGGGREVLDEDFFLYKEDVDLAWRLQRLGWTAWYEPDALAWHARGAGGPGGTSLRAIARTNRSLAPRVRWLSWRNHRLTMLKNEPVGSFLRDLPWIARRELLSLGYMTIADPGNLRVIPDLVRHLPAAMRKRRSVARRARTGPAELRRWIVSPGELEPREDAASGAGNEATS
jgi:GT2 family glycosyltransferase